VIDGTGFGARSAWDRKIYEVTKYCVIPPGGTSGNGDALIMNLETYNKLPKDLHAVIAQAGADAEAYMVEASLQSKDESMADLKAKGMDVYTLPADEIARWRTAVQPVYDKWLKANGTNGKTLFDFALKHLKSNK
jgi:TRAP-type C4-dicarboxylate transport system substrate-binding protein